jgi:3'(2'), 5'-bisphosphate nucleotidase
VPALEIAAAELIEGLTAIGILAAGAILGARAQGGIRSKADGSPVTAADEVADAAIHEGLAALAPAVPIVSEERAALEKGATAGTHYFLIDPLDGTREFIAGRDEYTVNIALIAEGAPALGVIVAPALGTIWRGIVGRGAERLEFSARRASAPLTIKTRPRPTGGELVVAVSRSHLDACTERYLAGLPRVRRLTCGSSVKFCRLAEGAADLYPRLAPTRDWDVAAGHAILMAAGGTVVDPDGAAVVYGSAELRIPAFIALGDPARADGVIKG